jgi:hypothetical protein
MATVFATDALSRGGCGEGSCIGFSPTYSTAVSTCKAMESSPPLVRQEILTGELRVAAEGGQIQSGLKRRPWVANREQEIRHGEAGPAPLGAREIQ